MTGATGFIGRHIVESLQRRGAKVIAVVRNPDKVPEFRENGVVIRVADLADRAALKSGFGGSDAVISSAALFRMGSTDWGRHLRDNVNGTENVMLAAADAGISRVVHVSSVAVYRGNTGPEKREDAPMLGIDDLGVFNAYSVSKAISENRAWELASSTGIRLSCSRPSSVFGPFDPNITPAIARMLSMPVMIVPSIVKLGLVYAGDVAEGTVTMLENDASIGKSYNLTGPHTSMTDFFRAWHNAGGPWSRLALNLPVPFRRLWDNTLAETELGWRNRPYIETLKETFERDPALCCKRPFSTGRLSDEARADARPCAGTDQKQEVPGRRDEQI